MASRILFEDEIDSNNLNNTNALEVITKTEQDESNCSQDITAENENQDLTDTEINSTEDSKIMGNVIVLGSKIPKTIEIPIEYEGNSQSETNIGMDKPKSKRRNKTELEMLGIDIDIKENDDKFDVENEIFRKYKLRKIEQPISYKEEDIKPKRRISTDNETSLSCPICQEEFENKVGFSNHLRIHDKTVCGYTCSLCNQKFDKNADLIAHKPTHKDHSFLCQKCKLAFSNHCDFLLHNYEHLNQPHFKCPECGLRYRKSMYRAHIATHFSKNLSCDLCSFVTNNEINLRVHTNKHSNTFTCVECGKEYNNRESYNYHMSVHTGVKKYQCLYCGVGFRTKNAKLVHTRRHTGERPYTCDVCGYKASQSGSMQLHKEGHGEKKYTCAECGKKYTHKCYLVIHMRSHTKNSLYECPECNAQFVSIAGLKVHSLYKHTDERPFECKPCDSKFINYNQYRKHCRAKYHLRNVYRD